MDRVLLTRVVGIVFLIIGIWGFFQNPIFGAFEVDSVHNWVHILSGIAALALSAQGERGSETFGRIATVVYGLVMIAGFAMGNGKLLGIMQLNMADNFLHLVLTAIFAYIGFAPHAVTREHHRPAY